MIIDIIKSFSKERLEQYERFYIKRYEIKCYDTPYFGEGELIHTCQNIDCVCNEPEFNVRDSDTYYDYDYYNVRECFTDVKYEEYYENVMSSSEYNEFEEFLDNEHQKISKLKKHFIEERQWFEFGVYTFDTAKLLKFHLWLEQSKIDYAIIKELDEIHFFESDCDNSIYFFKNKKDFYLATLVTLCEISQRLYTGSIDYKPYVELLNWPSYSTSGVSTSWFKTNFPEFEYFLYSGRVYCKDTNYFAAIKLAHY